ncbi:MATE efflux family protein [Perilla frutescens var. hirtella]|nr:MATE efflux family protein [Perilla frutescens var. hirtella]
MAHYIRESEEEALFRSYPYAVYFVQSPSSISHANSNINIDNLASLNQQNDAPALALSPYSSRGSNNSLQFSHNTKYNSHRHHQNPQKSDGGIKKNAVDQDCEDDHEAEEEMINGGDYHHQGWIKYFSFSYSNSGWWILMQLSWRFLLSFIIALLVFYVAAKPPPPKFSVQVAGIPQFRLGEGVDASGVTTKILSCNFSIDVTIDNNSKLFALHIHPPIMQLIFGRLTFAISQMQGREVYGGSDDLTSVRFHVGTKNKAMYGAGRNMQDFLESGNGLPLIVRLLRISCYAVIWVNKVGRPESQAKSDCQINIHVGPESRAIFTKRQFRVKFNYILCVKTDNISCQCVLRSVLKRDELGLEILRIALPAALALAADPIASLIDTAFIGHLGPVELAAVGVSIAIFNQASKVTIFPLVSITTSFVAEEDTIRRMKAEEEEHETSNKVDDVDLEKSSSSNTRRHIPSASTALALGLVLGILQTIFLVFLAKPLLSLMGVKSESLMAGPARKYLTIRSLGAPAVLLSLAMQGVFRGFKDTTTPLFATGDVTNIILDPILIFVCGLGVSGAAIAHVLDLSDSGFLLLARVVAATICVTLAASMAARLGPTPMAAFQICLQVWITSSLLADGLAVAGQAILACAFAEKDYHKATAAAARVLQMGFVLGVGLAVLVGVGLQFGSGIFSKDKNVIHIIAIGIPFVAATQPINSLAFVFDGVVVSIASIGSLFILSKTNGYVGIWLALTIYMTLRTFVGFWRMGTGTGPWRFLKVKG